MKQAIRMSNNNPACTQRWTEGTHHSFSYVRQSLLADIQTRISNNRANFLRASGDKAECSAHIYGFFLFISIYSSHAISHRIRLC